MQQINNFIHPTSTIDPTVILGKNNYIGPYCYITGNTVIGNNNRFEGYCSIGTPAESRKYFTHYGEVHIGNNNTIREYVTINAGTWRPTSVGNNNIMLRGSHLGHDVVMENNITLSCNVLIGGHTWIMEGVNCGLGSITHQRVILGAFAMIGMGAIVTKKTPITPGNVYVGNPAKLLRENNLDRFGLTKTSLLSYIETYTSILEKPINN